MYVFLLNWMVQQLEAGQEADAAVPRKGKKRKQTEVEVRWQVDQEREKVVALTSTTALLHIGALHQCSTVGN